MQPDDTIKSHKDSHTREPIVYSVNRAGGQTTLTRRDFLGAISIGAIALNASSSPANNGDESPEHAAVQNPYVSLLAHSGDIKSVIFSPDGTLIATASNDQTTNRDYTIKLWSWPLGTLVTTLTGHKGAINDIAFSPDSQYLASASSDNTVKIWSVSARELTLTLEGHTDRVRCISFNPDSTFLCSAGADNAIKVWRIPQGSIEFSVKNDSWLTQYSSVSINADNTYLATANSNEIEIYSWPEMRLIKRLAGHSSIITKIVFSSDGLWLASASKDNSVKLWSLEDMSLSASFIGHTENINSVAFTPDSQYLASASSDRTIRIWSLNHNSLMTTYQIHKSAVNDIAFSNDGLWLASVSSDRTLKVLPCSWPLIKPDIELNGHTNSVNYVTFSPDGKWIASASNDKTINIWSWPKGELYQSLALQNKVLQAVFSPNGKWLAATDRYTIKIWSWPTGVLVCDFEPGGGEIYCLTFSPDSKWVASGSWDRKVRVSSCPDGKPHTTLSGLQNHSKPINTVAFSLDGRYILSASSDQTIKVWFWPEARYVTTLAKTSGAANCFNFSSDGHWLSTSAPYDFVKTTEWPRQGFGTQYFIKDLNIPHTSRVENLSYSPDGKWLATSSKDHTVKITPWPINGQFTCFGQADSATFTSFSPDSQWLCVAGRDSSVKVYYSESWNTPPTYYNLYDPSVMRPEEYKQVVHSEKITEEVDCHIPIPQDSSCICDCVSRTRKYTIHNCICNTVLIQTGQEMPKNSNCVCNTITIGTRKLPSGSYTPPCFCNSVFVCKCNVVWGA